MMFSEVELPALPKTRMRQEKGGEEPTTGKE
jgi:hypothetical protein